MMMKENYRESREKLEELFRLFLVPRDIWFCSTGIVDNLRMLHDACYALFDAKMQDSFISLVILVESIYDVELEFNLLEDYVIARGIIN
jgi:hypothetical protein